MRTRYNIDSYQQTYFMIDSFQQLFDLTAPDFTPLYAQLKHLGELRRMYCCPKTPCLANARCL